MTRTRQSEKEKDIEVDSAKIKVVHKVFLINGCNEVDGNTIISLPNPASGAEVKYMIGEATKTLSEVIEFNEPNRCFFLNDDLCINGKIYFTTPVDPLFMLIYVIHNKCQKQAIPLNQLYLDEEFQKLAFLNDFLTEEQMALVADLKGSDDFRALKFNEEKTMKWLITKCRKVSETLKKKSVSNLAKSATFVSEDDSDGSPTDEHYLITSYEIMRKYVTSELCTNLAIALNINLNKRKSIIETDDRPSSKRSKNSDDVEPLKPSNGREVKAVPKKSKNAIALEKAASGTKSISSFFKKA